jgi:four helix bundle protein
MNNNDFKKVLEDRTLQFSIASVKFYYVLDSRNYPKVLMSQFIRSSTSIGANYREANRAESKNDFIHKIGISEKESAETVYWLLVIQGIISFDDDDQAQFDALLAESRELLAIFNSISRNSKK